MSLYGNGLIYGNGKIYFTSTVPPDVFGDSFETNDFSLWDTVSYDTGATVTVQGSVKHHGNYAMMSTLSESYDWGVVQNTLSTSYGTVYFREYMRVSALPANNGDYYNCSKLSNTTNTADFITVQIAKTAGTVTWRYEYYTNGDVYGTLTTTITPAVDTWYCVEMKAAIGNGTGHYYMWIDEVLVGSITALSNNDDGNIGLIELGHYNPTTALNLTGYHDCFVFDDEYIGADGTITPPSPENLAYMPDSWSPYEYGLGAQITHLETDPAHWHNGHPSIRIDKHVNGVDINYVRELDLNWYPISVGDTLVLTCWIKTESAEDTINNDDPYYGGARMGCDFYTNNYSVDGLPGQYFDPYDTQWGWVAFGQTDWVSRSLTFTVPATQYTIAQDGVTTIDPSEQICGLQMWIMVAPPHEEGKAWFADATMTINQA